MGHGAPQAPSQATAPAAFPAPAGSLALGEPRSHVPEMCNAPILNYTCILHPARDSSGVWTPCGDLMLKLMFSAQARPRPALAPLPAGSAAGRARAAENVTRRGLLPPAARSAARAALSMAPAPHAVSGSALSGKNQTEIKLKYVLLVCLHISLVAGLFALVTCTQSCCRASCCRSQLHHCRRHMQSCVKPICVPPCSLPVAAAVTAVTAAAARTRRRTSGHNDVCRPGCPQC